MYKDNPFYQIDKFAQPPIFIDPLPVTDPLPPIWLPPAPDNQDPKVIVPIIIDPIRIPPVKEGLRSFVYAGLVRDAVSELPLPYATVRLYAAGNLIDQKITDAKGRFEIVTDKEGESLVISEAEHKAFQWPASQYQKVFDLERKEITLPPVLLPPGSKKNNTWLWVIGLAILAKSQKWI